MAQSCRLRDVHVGWPAIGFAAALCAVVTLVFSSIALLHIRRGTVVDGSTNARRDFSRSTRRLCAEAGTCHAGRGRCRPRRRRWVAPAQLGGAARRRSWLRRSWRDGDPCGSGRASAGSRPPPVFQSGHPECRGRAWRLIRSADDSRAHGRSPQHGMGRHSRRRGVQPRPTRCRTNREPGILPDHGNPDDRRTGFRLGRQTQSVRDGDQRDLRTPNPCRGWRSAARQIHGARERSPGRGGRGGRQASEPRR